MSDFHYENPRPLPDTLPLLDISGGASVFSTASGHLHNGGRYLSTREGQGKLIPHQFQEIASALFFRGGKLADHGLEVRENLDPTRVLSNIRHLLSSFEPSHEDKIATAGFALMQWCKPLGKSAK